MHTACRRLAKKAKVRFADYVRPDPYPPDIELRLGVYQWLVRTAHQEQGGSEWGPLSLLSGKPTCGADDSDPIMSIADLDRRFHFALLSAYGDPDWRLRHRIDVSVTRWIHFPHYRGPGGRAVEERITRLLETSGRLTVVLNDIHPLCNHIHHVRIAVTAKGFRLVLTYGIRYCHACWDTILFSMQSMTAAELDRVDERDLEGDVCAAGDDGLCRSCGKSDALRNGSSWKYVIDETGEGEPAIRAIDRALSWIDGAVEAYRPKVETVLFDGPLFGTLGDVAGLGWAAAEESSRAWSGIETESAGLIAAWRNLEGDAAGMARYVYERMSDYTGPDCQELLQRLIGLVAGPFEPPGAG